MAGSEHRTLLRAPRYLRDGELSYGSLDDLRAFITLSRTHSSDCGQRHVFVRVDGGEKVRLAFGDSFTVEVQPGAHHLRIHNTLVWKNVRFTIELGEHLDFLISNEARWWTWGMVAVLGSAPLFLRVERRSRL
jgi:hypothetical protein